MGFEFDLYTGRTMVRHVDRCDSAVTADAVFIFQEYGKFLLAWLVIGIIVGNTEFPADKARSSHEFQLQCCFSGKRLSVDGFLFIV